MVDRTHFGQLPLRKDLPGDMFQLHASHKFLFGKVWKKGCSVHASHICIYIHMHQLKCM